MAQTKTKKSTVRSSVQTMKFNFLQCCYEPMSQLLQRNCPQNAGKLPPKIYQMLLASISIFFGYINFIDDTDFMGVVSGYGCVCPLIFYIAIVIRHDYNH